MRTMFNTLSSETAITVGRRKDGSVALMFDDDTIAWFKPELMKFWVEAV